MKCPKTCQCAQVWAVRAAMEVYGLIWILAILMLISSNVGMDEELEAKLLSISSGKAQIC